MIKIYVPDHLRKLKVVDDMCRMIDSFVQKEDGQTVVEDSFSDYNSYLASDPVLEFIDYIYDLDEVDEEKREAEVTYLTNYFYCLKGTQAVLDGMGKKEDGGLLDLTVSVSEGSERYTVSSLNISVNVPDGLDSTRFSDLLDEFLKALLLFCEIKSQTVPLKIEGDMRKYVYICDLMDWYEYDLTYGGQE